MSFSFTSTPKTATGFTLPTSAAPTTAPSGGFSFGLSGAGGEPVKPTTAPPLFGTSTPSTGPGLTFGVQAAKTAPALSLGTTITSTSAAPGPPTGLSFGISQAASSASAPQFSFSAASTAAAAATAPKTTALSFTPITKTSLSATPATTAPTAGPTAAAPSLKVSFKTPATTAATAVTTAAATTAPALTLGTTTTSSVVLSAPAVTTTTATTPAPTASLTFNQLEDMINKWTIDLEEQSKVFINQAKQLNAWDMLLISNGEKVLNLNNGIERVKQQQQQLDQELDFVLAQQKELEELIVPLEKELSDIPITDQERNYTYQLAEKLDSQLKQMSEDLKEIIENLNESNKSDELADPVIQISRIMNAHMNSLQWIDRNIAEISAHLEQISKLQDLNRRNNIF